MPRYKSDERDDGGGNDNPHASSTKRSHQTTDAVRTKHRDRKIDEDVGMGRGTERSKRRHVLEQQRINHAVDTARCRRRRSGRPHTSRARACPPISPNSASAVAASPGTNTVRPLRRATATRPIVAVSIAARANPRHHRSDWREPRRSRTSVDFSGVLLPNSRRVRLRALAEPQSAGAGPRVTLLEGTLGTAMIGFILPGGERSALRCSIGE